MAALFSPGSIVATPGALAALCEAGADPLMLLSRQVSGDWGDVPAEDAAENQYSLTRGLRLVSSYRLSNAKRVWVITERERILTTILLPSEC